MVFRIRTAHNPDAQRDGSPYVCLIVQATREEGGGHFPRARHRSDQGCAGPHGRLPAHTCIAILLGVLLTAVAGSAPTIATGSTRTGRHKQRPNIVLIRTDDQTFAQFNPSVMPETERLLAGNGATFTDYIATTAQCCPSRASLITGQYPHNHGVTSNAVGYPGLKAKDNVLPVWLHRAGYRTMHVGAKYLNGYEQLIPNKLTPAPGWSNWFTSLSGSHYYDYGVSANGRGLLYGHSAGDYITRVLGTKARDWVDTYAPEPRPFYLQLDERAPHVSFQDDPFGNCDRVALPDPRNESLSPNDPLPQSPSFNEEDMSDKPSFLRRAPLLGPTTQQRLSRDWNCALASLTAVESQRRAGVQRCAAGWGALQHRFHLHLRQRVLLRGAPDREREGLSL